MARSVMISTSRQCSTFGKHFFCFTEIARSVMISGFSDIAYGDEISAY